MHSSRREFAAGIKAELPLLVGVIPFGMIYGVLALAAGIPPGAAQAMSAVVFAGSSQFIATQLFGVGAPAMVIFTTAVVVNLRHALYSASIAPYLRCLNMPIGKLALAYLLTDEAYAVSISRYQQADEAVDCSIPDRRHWFLLGAGLALWSTWQLSTALGIFLGAQVPSSWSLDFTLALTFIAIIVPALKDRPAWAAALSAGVVAVLAVCLALPVGSDRCLAGGYHSWDAAGEPVMTLWLTMVAIGIATFAIRFSFIYLFGRYEIPDRLRRALRFVPPAVLTAIVFPELLMPGGVFDFSLWNGRLLAGTLAALVAWRTKNVVLTILVGMAALYILQALG